MPTETYNMNLSERYLTNWGAWEVIREIICNAIDSDSDYTVTEQDISTVKITTKHIVDPMMFLVIGAGTKSVNDQNIGQFGEGIKMAALTATRAGGNIEILSGNSRITFFLSEMGSQRVLHASLNEVEKQFEGCEVTVSMPGICQAMQENYRPDLGLGPHTPTNDKAKIFVRGIYICDLPNGLFTWNFSDLKINRDRNIPDQEDILNKIIAALLKHGSTEDFVKIVADKMNMFESSSVHVRATLNKHPKVVEAIRRIHGKNVVLAKSTTPVRITRFARALGQYVITQDSYFHWYETVTKIEDFYEQHHKKSTQKIDKVEYEEELKELYRLAEYLKIDNFEIEIVEELDAGVYGQYRFDANLIEMREDLFHRTKRRDRIATFLHELAHHNSREPDETLAFEHSLEQFATSFAMDFLKL